MHHSQEEIWWSDPTLEVPPFVFSDALTESVGGAYLFDLTIDPTETTNLLWALFASSAEEEEEEEEGEEEDGDEAYMATGGLRPSNEVRATTVVATTAKSVVSQSWSAGAVRDVFVGAAEAFCGYYENMVPALWRPKQGAAKQVGGVESVCARFD